jgi:hypothetical protein
MKFFTPELYLRFNSPDDAIADRADAEWQEALRAYEHHLEPIRDNLAPRLKDLADKYCFHDAELLSLREDETEPIFFRHEPFPFPFPFIPFLPVALLALKHEGELVVLLYLLWHRVRRSTPPEDWPFSSEKQAWLYDELDVDQRGRGMFWHRILFSDGTELEIPFFDVLVQRVSVDELVRGQVAVQDS